MELLLLKIAGTEDTPEIGFDPDNSTFSISGRSLPEDVTSFYAPVFDWLSTFDQFKGKSTFVFKLEYFNTASSKMILDILMKLEELVQENSAPISVEWHYSDGDDDMQEAGEEYKELVELNFSLVAY